MEGLTPDELIVNVRNLFLSNEKLLESDISVSADGDDLILNGDVDSTENKWLAEEIAYNVLGVIHVTNNLNVISQLH